MADETENTASSQSAAAAPNPGGGSAAIIRLALAGVIVVAAAGGGYFTAKVFNSRPAKADQLSEATEGHKEAKEGKEAKATKSDNGYVYHRIDPIIANINEPRMMRYIRATITLSIKNSDDGEASATLEKSKVKIKDWLTRYLMGCTLEDLRGRDNYNRIRKEILASLNEQLWPQQKPLIAEVFLEEFNVQ